MRNIFKYQMNECFYCLLFFIFAMQYLQKTQLENLETLETGTHTLLYWPKNVMIFPWGLTISFL